MPPWGRPPRGLNARSRREWERQARDWEEYGRFEELDSEDEEEEADVRPRIRPKPSGRFRGDELRFHGYDIGQARRGPPQRDVDELAELDEGYEDDYDGGGGYQAELREKEEELAERALRRIRRARMRGETDVDLTREELDALERRRDREALVVQRPQPPVRRRAAAPPASTAPTAAGSKPKKRTSGGGGSSSGFLGFGGGGGNAPRAKKQTAEKRITVPIRDTTPQTPPSPEDYREPPSSYRPGSGQGASSSRPNSRSASRARQQRAQQSPPYDPPPVQPLSHRPASSSSRRPSPTRSLPDDPDWTPRSRSSSSAQLYSNDPYAYQVSGPASTSRRNVSGPASISYSNVRRNIPPAGSTVRVPVGSRGAAAVGGSALATEVIEISSDEAEDESDEGVRVDLDEEDSDELARDEPLAVVASGRGNGPGGGRARRGGRR
ncbi:MAG: hypothetical protein M1828_000073 [Chrysothrix sp. TS-e1954]|nr:MAG: hypothetical protein M1828_000073 [Chrysothrix sp. TS-e1954]